MNILLEAIHELNKLELEEENILEKNYPDLSNAVESCEILYYILLNKSIKGSEIAEDDIYNLKKYLNNEGDSVFKYDKLDGYVCTSRDLVMHSKLNEENWGWAVILDGDKLSNKYKIRPVNQRYPEILKASNKDIKGTKIKYLTVRSLWSLKNEKQNKYKYYLELLGYPIIEINKDTFKEIENLILDINKSNSKYPFDVIKNKKDFNNSENIIEVKYWRPSASSVLKLTKNNISDKALTDILKSNTLNDKEEKILFKNTNSDELNKFNSSSNIKVNKKGVIKIINLLTGDSLYTNGIDISGCIKGIVIPEYAKKMIESKNFDFRNIPISLATFKQRNNSLTRKNTFLNTIEENKSIAYWLSKISEIFEPEWKIVTYKSKKDSYVNKLFDIDDQNNLKSDNELQNKSDKTHINVTNYLNLDLGRVINTKKGEDSFCVIYSPNSNTKEQLTRVSSRILLWGKDKENIIRVAIQIDNNNNYELPGGGFNTKSDTAESVLFRELKEELNIFPWEIKNLKQVPSYWYSMNSNWVKSNTYNSNDVWTGYFNYFFVGEYSKVITENIVDNSNKKDGEKTYWVPLEILLKRSQFYANHNVSWLEQAKKINDK